MTMSQLLYIDKRPIEYYTTTIVAVSTISHIPKSSSKLISTFSLIFLLLLRRGQRLIFHKLIIQSKLNLERERERERRGNNIK